MGSLASAQYTFDPASADEQTPGTRYFGSAKDDNGALLAGVTVEIDTPESKLVVITDAQGRFRVKIRLDTEALSLKCYKAGFELVRVIKRPGTGVPKPTVQVDCVLRRANAR